MKFTKMHGTGNDYIYIDCFEEKVENPAKLAVKLSDRHFGIGGDGIILIFPSAEADCRMDMYNADGSRGKMCGNGIRCVAAYMVDQKRINKTEMTVETQSGIKKIRLNLKNGMLQDVTVNMGAPVLTPELIPVRPERISDHGMNIKKDPAGGYIVSEPISTEYGTLFITCVSMGNPHAILFVDDVASAPVEKVGRYLEHHPAFPEGTNVEFIELIDDETVRMRVWERGSGETLACGTGACASVVACVLNGKTKRQVRVRLTGGDLGISWDEKDGSVYMTGPAKRVFTGEVDPDEL